MKRILLFLLVLCTTTVYAQDSNLQENECYRYAMVSFPIVSTVNRKYYIRIQEGGAVDEPHKLTDENEGVLTFPTWIDALNYLSLQGWEVAWHNSNTNMMEQWILKKRIKKELLEGMVNHTLTIKQKK